MIGKLGNILSKIKIGSVKKMETRVVELNVEEVKKSFTDVNYLPFQGVFQGMEDKNEGGKDTFMLLYLFSIKKIISVIRDEFLNDIGNLLNQKTYDSNPFEDSPKWNTKVKYNDVLDYIEALSGFDKRCQEEIDSLLDYLFKNSSSIFKTILELGNQQKNSLMGFCKKSYKEKENLFFQTNFYKDNFEEFFKGFFRAGSMMISIFEILIEAEKSYGYSLFEIFKIFKSKKSFDLVLKK